MKRLFTLLMAAALFCVGAFSADTTAPLAAPAAVFGESDGVIALEAEHFFEQTLTEKRAWHITSLRQAPGAKPDADEPHPAGASGGAYVEALPDTRATHAEKLIKGVNFTDKPGEMAVLHFKIHVATPGRYFVWARAFSTGTEDNGFHIGLDGAWPASGQRWQTTQKNKWAWDCRQRTPEVHTGVPMQLWLDIEKAGAHEVAVAMREDGFELDKLVLARNADFKPEGHGPAVKVHSGAAPASFAAVGELNVVFILADDLGWGELGCYGQRKIPTPNVDRLAAQGMRFTQHYSGAPVCAPSRCVLMTGKHLGHAEVRGNQQARVKFPDFTEGQHPLSEQAVTIAQLFQKAGYATGAMGKWGLGPVGSTGDPNRKGFDLFFGYNCQSVAHSYYPPHLWRNAEKITINTKPIPGHAKQPDGEVKLGDWIGKTYAPKLMIVEAEKFIAANAARPFFLYLPFIEPHVAIHPPRESVEKFPPGWDTEVYRGANGYLPHPRPRAGYAAMINDLDSYVGRVLVALDRAGVTDRTLVIFTSDNGATHEGRAGPPFHVGGADPKFFNSTADLRGYKGSVYEGGIRVPMIARLPGRIAAGAVNETPGYFADWFPTLCDAAGLKKPAGLDGESLWPLLTGERKTLPSRKPMIWVFPEYQGQVAVRLGDFKLVRQGLKTKTPGAWEVYDLSKDRAEAHDLAALQPELIRQAEEILRREVSDNRTFPLAISGVNSAIH